MTPPKEIAKSSRSKMKQDKFMYLHSGHLRDEDLLAGTAELILQCKLSFQPNWNYHFMETFFPDFQVQGSFVHGSKSWAIGSHLSLLAAFRGLTWCSSQIIKEGPRMPVLSSWMFHNDLQTQIPLASTRIPPGAVVKSGLERDTTNWAEIAKALRDGDSRPLL